MIVKLLNLFIIAILLTGCSLPFWQSGQSALQINSNTEVQVYLNGTSAGQTPYYNDKIKPGTYDIRLSSPTDSTKEWQTNVTLAPGLITYIHRNFGLGIEDASLYILQLEPLPSKDATEISIITIPDNVIVKVDGKPEGFSPVSVKDVAEGDHSILLSAPGYQEFPIMAQVQKGHKLIVSATLAKLPPINFDPSQTATDSAQLATPSAQAGKPSPTPKATPKSTSPTATASGEIDKPYVVITETGTGWLRVRSEPSASGDNEVARLDVGVKVPYIESNQSGWYKIEYKTGEFGWISGRYAELVR